VILTTWNYTFSQRGANAGRRTFISNIPRSSDFDIQLPLAFWADRVRIRVLIVPLSSHLTEAVDSAAWATFGSFKIQNTWAWRLPSALQAVPSLIQVLMVLFVPESPRFLVNKGKEAQALKILAYYHADGDEYVWLCLSFELHLT
jgi:hypothetical protein